MTDMYKQEQCISNLEQQIGWIEDIKAHQFPGWGHTVNAMRQAIAMLKAQEPRVMTLEEVLATEVVYAEDVDKAEIIPVLVNRRAHDRIVLVRAHLMGSPSHLIYPLISEYCKRWRCWTSRPNDEQREATPWN